VFASLAETSEVKQAITNNSGYVIFSLGNYAGHVTLKNEETNKYQMINDEK